uniref:Uncharacterized protein n=1 Tax=Ignisphaera aggregans TaxID=334771 RepID=A0A7C2V9L8_9CREN
MVLSKTIASIALVILVALSVLPGLGLGTVLAQAPEDTASETAANATEPAGQSVNATRILIAKATVLKEMLNRTLALNISDDIKSKIVELLSVNVSELALDEVREWVRNATKLLSEVANEVRAGKAFRVGIVLQRYLNGLGNALRNRIRVLASKYNVTVEDLEDRISEIIANAKNASAINMLFKEMRKRLKDVEARRAKEFGDKAKEYLYRHVERVRGGDARGLDVAVKHIDKSIEILNKTLEKLRNVNASPHAVEAIEEAIERLATVKEILESVADEVGEVVDQARVREALNKTLEVMIARVNQSISELIEELRVLEEVAIQNNMTDLLPNISSLISRAEELRETLSEVESIDDVEQVIETLCTIRCEARRLARELGVISERIAEKAKNKLGNIVEKIIREADKAIERAEELYSDVINDIENARRACGQDQQQRPGLHGSQACRVVDVIERIVNLVGQQINRSKSSLDAAKDLYENGEYLKSFIYAQRALALARAAQTHLNTIARMLKLYPG